MGFHPDRLVYSQAGTAHASKSFLPELDGEGGSRKVWLACSPYSGNGNRTVYGDGVRRAGPSFVGNADRANPVAVHHRRAAIRSDSIPAKFFRAIARSQRTRSSQSLIAVWVQKERTVFGWSRRRRRTLKAASVTHRERDLLARSLPQHSRLGAEQQDQLIVWSRVFIEEKHWEGCDGLEITEEMKYAVAANAGMMVLEHPEWYYDYSKSILIYPRPYVARIPPHMADGQMGGEFPRSGETIFRGPVVLNWRDIVRSLKRPHEGRNLVVHEFAHQLDMLNGPYSDGMPPLPRGITEADWLSSLTKEYDAARDAVEAGYDVLIDDYGLTSMSEFFAVTSELYFQCPDQLVEYHPDVFRLLNVFYKLDLREPA